MDKLLNHYLNYDEESRLIKRYATQLEFDTTINCLTPYLKTSKTITELGAGTGRYALLLANEGHDVSAVEVVPEYVQTIKNKAKANNITLNVFESNAISVPFIEDASQDIVLVLGPLYHMQKLEERHQLVSEVKRILKKGGIATFAYINRHFMANFLAQKFPELITETVLRRLNEDGLIDHPFADSFFKIAYFSRPDEMEGLITKKGLSVIDHLSSDSISRFVAEGIDNFTPRQYKTWLNYHLQTCREKSILGLSQHGLLFGRK